MGCERGSGITSSQYIPASLMPSQRHSQTNGTCPSWLTPRRLGADGALAPSGALPSLCSRHPRIPPVAGNPFRPAGGLRAVNLRLPRLPPSVAACASIENSSNRSAMRVRFPFAYATAAKGVARDRKAGRGCGASPPTQRPVAGAT